MLKLMRLEWKKHHLSSYFKGMAICIVSIFTAMCFMSWISKVEDELIFTDYAGYMAFADIFIRITFTIFSAVILSKVVIEEYKNKTIQLLFTYPLQRKKLMQAKLLIVFLFCFFSMIITTFIMSMLVFILNPMIGFFEVPVHIQDMMAIVPTTLINSFMIAGVSLIPLYFGMRKKSTPATITSAILIGCVLSSSINGGSSQVSLFDFIAVPITLCILGLVIAYLSYRKIDQIDVT